MPEKTEISNARMREDARAIFAAGVAAVDAAAAMRASMKKTGDIIEVGGRQYNLREYKRIFVVGAGKAGAAMARATEEILGDRIGQGWINVKYGHLDQVEKVHIHEAGHPLPDEAGLKGTLSLVELIKQAGERDLVICLLSGGGSALLPLPVSGISLEEKQRTTELLLACGAGIDEVNAIRKHISRIKGGGLARLVYPATLICFILSDAVGDPLDVIASGPTVPDSTTFSQCLEIMEKYDLTDKVPAPVLSHIQRGVKEHGLETPKSAEPGFKKIQNTIIANNMQALKAAARKAEQLGYRPLILSSMVEGETREVARVHAAIAREIAASGHPLPPPACILSGGETTVTLRGKGLGGRNQEFALACALALAGLNRVVVLSGGTDGTDGPTDAAGAIVDGSTVKRAQRLSLAPAAFLRNNDSYHFFERLGDLLITGPTRTNVMDLRIMLISP